MAFSKEIRDLAKYAALNKGYVANNENFSSEDVRTALRTELTKYAGDYYGFQKHKMDIYELISQTVDAIVPMKVEGVMQRFAEIQTVPQGSRLTFKRKLGRNRAKQFIGRVSPAGIYETFRLDSQNFDLFPHAIGGGIRIDWERYLDGTEEWDELIEIVMEGIEEEVYKEINLELLGSYNASGRPANTKVSSASFDPTEMRGLINVVRSYGKEAVIFAPWQVVAAMGDEVVYGPSTATQNVSPADIEDMRTKGMIGIFHGAPIVALPNTYTDDTNTHFRLNPRVAFVLPVDGEKIVKVGFEGQTIVNDFVNAGDMSMEMMVYKKAGTGILYNNNWGIYEITSIVDTAWDQLAE